ncbi:Vitamin B12 import ATP-binding protein BtuD [anaerobic digester metagenome]
MLDKHEQILKIRNVSKHFKVNNEKNLIAVNQVNIDVYKGECLAIVGESGCGKSTLGKMITCIEKVTEGEIVFKNKAITSLNAKELRALRQEVQLVFQDPFNVFSPRMKIGNFLCEPLMNYEKLSKRNAWEKAKLLLESVELNPAYLEKFPHQLSGGELQRVVIARAMSLKPGFVVYDEVTSALDVSIQKQIVQLLTKLHQETGTTSIFISHDLALVQHISDRIIVMYLGKIVEIMESSQLGGSVHHPYTRELLNSVFSVHGDRHKKIDILVDETSSSMNQLTGCEYSQRCLFATERCLNEKPELMEKEAGHLISCHQYFR